ncbi:MAG: imidazole glycerol phosphate synthase subunit HisH, partial [Lachnospiraceae bacterium]|nr:imidazole glycerol phosphate synthase subunit HisH [Lachnospiraceae bacterium]
PGSRLMAGLEEEPFVYFVHSYYLHADDPSDVAAKTFYSCEIHAAVEHEKIFACQFHPEKSSETGLHILKNFCEV